MTSKLYVDSGLSDVLNTLGGVPAVLHDEHLDDGESTRSTDVAQDVESHLSWRGEEAKGATDSVTSLVSGGRGALAQYAHTDHTVAHAAGGVAS